MKKILVQPNSFENLGDILKTKVDGVILPLEHLAVNSEVYFSVSDIRSILNLTSKEVCVSINKIMHNEDLEFLEEVLVALNKMNISKIFFYDLAVMNMVKRLGIKKDLVIFQEHLNASIYSNHFYQKRGIQHAVLTNDITKEEINDISKYHSTMLICYGYLPIFYSRRYLITNYLKYIQVDKTNHLYYIKNKNDKYPIVEEEYGTTIYTKEPVHLIRELPNLDIDYIILNAIFTKREDFLSIIHQYVENVCDDEEHYQGFINRKTVYKVTDYE
jgi:putative protease